MRVSNSNDERRSCLRGVGVTKIFGSGSKKTVAVDHVDFDFKEGEIVTIVGESGSGKTTLSKMLLGLIAAGLFLKPAPLFLNYYTDAHLIDFFLGLLAGVIWHRIRETAPSGRPVLSGISGPAKYLAYAFLSVLAVCSLFYMILDPPLPFRLDYPCRFGLPSFAFVLALAILADRIVISPKVLSLCSMTYSVYLVEYFTTAVYKRRVSDRMSIVQTASSLVLLYAVTFALSVIPYRLIEVRLTSHLRRMFLPAAEKGGCPS